MRRTVPLAVLLVAAVAAQAQDGSAVLDAWRRSARAATAGVTAVTLDEDVVQVIEGPRDPMRLETRGSVRLAPDARPDRTVLEARVNGRPVEPARLPFLARRLGRAFGPAGGEAARPAPLPDVLLRDAQATGLSAETLGGQTVWRVAFTRAGRGADRDDGRRSQGQAWFSRGATLRLLRLELGGEGPNGTVRRTIDYNLVAGLDVPTAMRTEVSVRQRRRIRTFLITLTAEATYRGARVERR